ncbi:MAG: hypothetical protein M9910_11955 [Kiritimatiellae bacterium]|nr:hypothetical protein [Kiritimatiellia bacterium]
MMKILRILLTACVIQSAHAEYVGFSVPIFGGSQAGYDFDGTNGSFAGTWHSGGPTSNGYTLAVDPSYNSFELDPSYPPAPWNMSQPSIAHEGFDWDMRFWVTNYTGQISGLASGEIVTVFFLYKTASEQMAVIVDGKPIALLTLSEEALVPTRLERYGWATNGVPTGMPARVVGVAARTTGSALTFELAPLPPKTNTPPVHLYGIMLDTGSTSAIDNDQDGAPDWQECVAGTDSFNSNSVFRIAEFTQSAPGGIFVISWESASNRSYRVGFKTNLLEDAGGQLITNVLAEPPRNSVTTVVHAADNEFITIQVTQ